MPEDTSTFRLYLMRFVPLLLMQLLYKVVWVLAVALPMWSAVRGSDLTRAMAIGVVVDLIAIPWAYVLANFVKQPGDRWKRAPARPA